MMSTTPIEADSSSRYRGRGPSVFATYSRELALIGLMFLIIVLFSILFPRTFFSWDNFAAILRNLAFEGLLAIGMMLLLVSGSFDLSVGAMASMIGVITGWLMKEAGWPVPAAVIGGLAVATAAGAINGLVVAYLKVNALITTLGTMGIFKGIALLIGGPGITFLPESFSRFGRYELLGIQTPVWLMAIVAIGLHLLLTHTRFFRQYYYIGANAHAARLSGIHVERMQVAAFTVVGLIAGLAGIIYASRIATATATVGDGAELKAITAVILGGASLYGGKGTIWGALLGVFFTALIQNVLIILGARLEFSPEWQGIVMGLVLVLAVALDSLLTGRRTQ
jgi:ribose/xylose/arabinose/galactoside ABC-type transport system permease subunit